MVGLYEVTPEGTPPERVYGVSDQDHVLGQIDDLMSDVAREKLTDPPPSS